MKSNDQEKSLGALSLRAGIVTVLVLSALTILLKTGVITREALEEAKAQRVNASGSSALQYPLSSEAMHPDFPHNISGSPFQ